MRDDNRNELLRSPRIQHILGLQPPFMLRYGMFFIALCVIAIILLSVKVSYTNSVEVKYVICNNDSVRIFIPSDRQNMLNDQCRLQLYINDIEIVNTLHNGQGYVMTKDNSDKTYIIITFPLDCKKTYDAIDSIFGTARLCVTNDNIFCKIFKNINIKQ